MGQDSPHFSHKSPKNEIVDDTGGDGAVMMVRYINRIRQKVFWYSTA